MLFNTFLYPFFLATSVAVYWFLPQHFRKVSLIIFSLVFYAFSGFANFALIVILAIFVFLVGHLMLAANGSQNKKAIFISGVALVVAVLIWFKYGGLLAMSVAGLFGVSPAGYLKTLMPLGISFFTFEYIHYLIDLRAGRIADHKAIDFFTFAFFFPTLASGPIKRFQSFVPGISEVKRYSGQFFYTGIYLILFGYLEKYLIADNLISRTAFLATPSVAPSAVALLSGLFIYSFRLFFDFAGLSNIAIGSALLFGIKVPLNFDKPFLKADLALFWRSWHISLTSWIRDYIYMPLVFKFRNAKWMMFAGLIITMGLVGLWHGSSWNFLFFGLYHGFGLAALQIYRSFYPKRLLPDRISRVVGILFTFIYVSIGWGFFVTHSLSDSLLIYRTIFAKLI